MLAFRTLSFVYLKYFFVILIALSAFIVGFDLMENASDLPSSANLIILYIVFKTFYSVDLVLPLSLVFAMIASMVSLVKVNAIGAYYAIGYSKLRVIFPFLFVSILSILIYIGLHFSDFSKANEYADNIKNSSLGAKSTENLFFAHDGYHVYFQKLYPLSKSAHGVSVFEFDDNLLIKQMESSSAKYIDDAWQLEDVIILTPPNRLELSHNGYHMEHIDKIRIMNDFKPRILDQVYEGKSNFNVLEGVDALNLLENQNIDVAKIKNSIYKIFITPWFAIFMVIIVFTYTPLSGRFMNISKFSFVSILASLLVWGSLYVLAELSSNKLFAPELGVIFPVSLLLIFAMYRLLFSKQS